MESFSYWSQNSFSSRTILWCEPWCCVSIGHQKQVILLALLQDWRNLHTTWMRPPDAGGISLTKHCVVMARFARELTDTVLCCTQYSRVSEPGTIEITHSGTTQATSQLNRVCGQKQMLHMRKSWIPLQAVQPQEKPWQELLIFLVMISSEQVEPKWTQRVLARHRKNSKLVSEDWNDVTFTGQKIRWMKDSQSGSCIEVSQQKAIDKLEVMPVAWDTKEDLHCTPAMHTRYKINWRQIRTQFQCCYKFSRCASMAASPTIGDVNALNKLAKQLNSQPMKLQFWPLTGPLWIIGFPWYFPPKQQRWIFTKRHDSVLSRIAWAVVNGRNDIWKSNWLWKSKD